MGIKDKLRRLERQAEREAIVIPQWEGPPAKFPKSVLPEMFLHNLRRMCGEDLEPHPVSQAIANSPEPDRYSGTFLDAEQLLVAEDGEILGVGIEDLSEEQPI